MVILAAALAGAAGYGVYKGGEAGVKQAKMTRKEMVREKQRKSQQTDLSCKQTNRKGRIAQLASLRVNANSKPTTTRLSGANSSSSTSGGGSSWPLSRNSTTAAASTTSTTASTTTTESNANPSVDERLQNVMSKLKKEPEKPRGRLGKLFNNKRGGSY
jgi:hypothetical protein